MRKITNLFLALGVIAMMGVTTSCEDSATVPGPDITLSQTSTDVESGGTVYIAGTIVAEGKLDEVQISKTYADGKSETDQSITSFKTGVITEATADNTYNINYSLDNVVQDVTITIKAIDKNGASASQNYTVTVTAAPGEISEFTAILLGGQSTSEPSLLDANTGTRYTVANDEGKNHAADVDIVYYYGNTNNATLAAPDDETVDGTGANSFNWTGSWSTKNATRFGDSSIDFDAATDDSDIALIGSLTASKMTGLAIGDVLAFETAAGKKGILKVTALTDGESGSITLSVKIQK